MIFLSPNVKHILKTMTKIVDRFANYKLIILFKPFLDGYDWYPAYRFFQTVKYFDLHNVVDLRHRKKQKKSVQRYLHKKNGSLSQFLDEINGKDIDTVKIEVILEKRERCEEILGNVPFQQTLWLSEYYKFFGDLRIADFLRRQSLISLLNEQKKTTSLLPRSVQAAIELNRFEDAMEILQKKKAAIKKEKIEKCRQYTLMRLGKNTRIKQIKGKNFSEGDHKFEEYIQGKTIAIVGPAIPETCIADEINSFDLVVRTNFPVGNSLPADIYGRPPDISYNFIDTSPLAPDIDLSEFSNRDDVKFTIFNNENIEKNFKRVTKNHKILSRTNFDCAGIFWSGFPMAVQRIIYDLLHFSPLKIKIFSVNFYTSKKSIHDKYVGPTKKNLVQGRASRCHDLISNFMFCKSLYESGIVSSDKTGKNILELDRIGYTELANEIIGNVFLDADTITEKQ